MAAIAELKPDLVHAHSAGIYGGAAVTCGRPAVITAHGVIGREAQQAWPLLRWPDRLRWLSDARYERWVVGHSQEIIAISPYIVAEFGRRTRARFHLIENPVDESFFAADRPPPVADRLLCVAR